MIDVLRYTLFWHECVLNDGGLLNPKSSDITSFFRMILCRVRKPWDFFIRDKSSSVFLQISLFGEVLTPLQLKTLVGDKLLEISIGKDFRAPKGSSSQSEEPPQKNRGASLS